MTSTKDKVTQRVTDVVLREGAQRRPHRRHSCCGQRQAALFIQAYKSKQAIFEACTDFFSERVADVGNAIGLPGSAGTEGSYADVGVEEIVDFTTQLLVFYLHDDVVAKFRRMLTIERHREPKLNREIERLFIDGRSNTKKRCSQNLWTPDSSKGRVLTFLPCAFTRPYSIVCKIRYECFRRRNGEERSTTDHKGTLFDLLA